MKTQGFTLIELMIVIAILGILLAIAIPAYREWAGYNGAPRFMVECEGIEPVFALHRPYVNNTAVSILLMDGKRLGIVGRKCVITELSQ